MDLGPVIVIVIFIGLIAFSMAGRMRDDRDGRPGSDLRPPGEPGDADRIPLRSLAVDWHFRAERWRERGTARAARERDREVEDEAADRKQLEHRRNAEPRGDHAAGRRTDDRPEVEPRVVHT